MIATTPHDRAMNVSTAIRGTTPSYSPALDAHQRGARATAPLSRGHHVHVVSNQPKKGFSVTPPDVLTHLLPVDWRRLARRPFPIHVSARGAILSRLSRKRVCSIPLGHTRAYSHDLTGANRSVVQSTPRKHVSRRLAYVGKHLRRLSYSPSFDGSKTIEKAFRDGRISFGGQQIVFLG